MSDVISFKKDESHSKFKPGDLVTLRSGSPNLTVRTVSPSRNKDQYGTVTVDWFADGESLAGTYFDVQLVLSSQREEEE